MYVCLFNVLETRWGPTDKFLFLQIHLDQVKILLVKGKQLLITPLHALDSYLVKKSEALKPLCGVCVSHGDNNTLRSYIPSSCVFAYSSLVP